MGISDSGGFLARSIAGGAGGGLLAAAWAALVAMLSGLPWWSPLALFSTTLMGLSRQGIDAAGLFGAVVAGIVWLMMAGLAGGAVFGLIFGTFAPTRLRPTGFALLGAAFGLVMFGVLVVAGLPWGSPAFVGTLPAWTRAIAAMLMGWIIGRSATPPAPVT